MKDEMMRGIGLRYIRIFPELLDRYHSKGDNSIVRLISNKIFDDSDEKFINVTEIEKKVKTFLDGMLKEV